MPAEIPDNAQHRGRKTGAITAPGELWRISLRTGRLLDYSSFAVADRIPQISGSAIVLVGSFNPAIFQPQWFGRQQLLPEAEVQSSEIKLIHPQICHFETERFIVQVTTERFIGASKQNTNAAVLRDLVLGTFFILEHTPVSAMGLNRQMHFAVKNEEEWHSVGDRLAPKAGWNAVLEGRPGMLSLEINTQKSIPSGSTYKVKVQPSSLVNPGVYIETNDHYPDPNATSPKDLMNVLQKNWEDAQSYAAKVANHILSWATE